MARSDGSVVRAGRHVASGGIPYRPARYGHRHPFAGAHGVGQASRAITTIWWPKVCAPTIRRRCSTLRARGASCPKCCRSTRWTLCLPPSTWGRTRASATAPHNGDALWVGAARERAVHAGAPAGVLRRGIPRGVGQGRQGAHGAYVGRCRGADAPLP